MILINKFSRVIDTNTVHGELVSMRYDTIRWHRTQNTHNKYEEGKKSTTITTTTTSQ